MKNIFRSIFTAYQNSLIYFCKFTWRVVTVVLLSGKVISALISPITILFNHYQKKHPELKSGWSDEPFFIWWKAFTLNIFLLLSFGSIFLAQKLDYDFSPDGWNYFVFGVMKVPLGFATAMMAILTLWISNYRSRQVQTQIQDSKKKDTFTNYFAHQNIFEERLAAWSQGKDLGPVKKFSYCKLNTHRSIFKDSKNGDFTCREFILSSSSLILKLTDQLNAIECSAEDSNSKKILARKINSLSKVLRLQETPIRVFFSKYSIHIELRKVEKTPHEDFYSEKLLNLEGQLRYAFDLIKCVSQVIDDIIGCSFTDDLDHKFPAEEFSNYFQEIGEKWQWADFTLATHQDSMPA